MDYLISRNAGDRTLAAIEEIVGALGPVMVFEPGTYEAGTLKDRLADAIREAPNTPITFVMNFKDSGFANWASPLLGIFHSRVVLGEILPEKSNFILLTEIDGTQLSQPGTSALLARVHVIDLKAVVAAFPGHDIAIIDHEIGHLAVDIERSRAPKPSLAELAVDNTLNTDLLGAVSKLPLFNGRSDDVLKSWQEMSEKNPDARILGRTLEVASNSFKDYYFKEGLLMVKRDAYREMLAKNGPMPAILSNDPSDQTTWSLKFEVIKARPDVPASEAQLEDIKRAIELGQFQIEIAPSKKAVARIIDLGAGL